MPSIRFEICNKCNLSCPSCQEGRINFAGRHEPFHYANLDLCDKIFQRIREYNPQYDIYLYMYCEPCLHPQLNEILHLMDQYRLKAYISSNLNVHMDWEQLLSHSSLKRLTISISGMSQKMYEKGQRGGNFALLMGNMKQISLLAPNFDTEIYVLFHQYQDNMKDEEQCRELCQQYNFKFVPSPAFFMYSPWDNPSDEKSLLKDGIENTIPRLLVEKDFFMESIPSLEKIPCPMEISNDIAIDSHGYVHHSCCMSPMIESSRCGQFTEMSLDEIFLIENKSPVCKLCKKNGYHVQFSLTPHVEYTMLAKQRGAIRKKPSVNTVIRRFLKSSHKINSLKDTPIYVYGAIGNAGIMTLLQAKGYNIKGCIDDSKDMYGSTYCGLRISNLDHLSREELKNSCILICFIRDKEYIESFKRNLSERGVHSVYALYEFFYLHEVNALAEAETA